MSTTTSGRKGSNNTTTSTTTTGTVSHLLQHQHTQEQSHIQQKHLKLQQQQAASVTAGQIIHRKGRAINKMDIIDRKVIHMTSGIIWIIKIIVHDTPGNSCHIMSDNKARISINIMNYSIASEFNMNIDIMIDSMEYSFTKMAYIKLKDIIEKFAQDDFDLTLHIKNCVKIQYISISLSINFRQHHRPKVLQQKLPGQLRHLPAKYYIKNWHNKVHNKIEKNIIQVDISIDILDSYRHFAQKGYTPPCHIESDISGFEWHFAIGIGIDYLEQIEVNNIDFRPQHLRL